MDAAKKGIITKEMQVVSEKEGINIETLMNLMAEGKIVIPANKNHKSISAEGVGQGLRTKINVNLGISKDNILVVGDSGNDVSMFDCFNANSYCMSHAPDSVKAHAAHVIDKVADLEQILYPSVG